MKINNLQLKRPWSGQSLLNLVNMVKKSQSTWNVAELRWRHPLPPCRQKVEKMIWRMPPVRLYSPLFGRLRPDWNGLKFRLRVKTGGHNNTQLNPVFRGMPTKGNT
jgi:hypothetical protein